MIYFKNILMMRITSKMRSLHCNTFPSEKIFKIPVDVKIMNIVFLYHVTYLYIFYISYGKVSCLKHVHLNFHEVVLSSLINFYLLYIENISLIIFKCILKLITISL